MPFFSPDGQWIGFFTNARLKKVAVASGAVQNITDNAAEARGGVWAPDGTIYYAPHNVAALKKVPASGGSPVEATQLDRPRGEISHRWPRALAGWLAAFLVAFTRPLRSRPTGNGSCSSRAAARPWAAVTWAMRLQGDRTPRQLLPSVANGQVSPDGRWLALTSRMRPASFEVFATPFPGPGPRIPVSSNGGDNPLVVSRRARNCSTPATTR